ncbi:hypothetical protein IAT40_003148 [Kwoniella sp. CBS 6097]
MSSPPPGGFTGKQQTGIPHAAECTISTTSSSAFVPTSRSFQHSGSWAPPAPSPSSWSYPEKGVHGDFQYHQYQAPQSTAPYNLIIENSPTQFSYPSQISYQVPSSYLVSPPSLCFEQAGASLASDGPPIEDRSPSQAQPSALSLGPPASDILRQHYLHYGPKQQTPGGPVPTMGSKMTISSTEEKMLIGEELLRKKAESAGSTESRKSGYLGHDSQPKGSTSLLHIGTDEDKDEGLFKHHEEALVPSLDGVHIGVSAEESNPEDIQTNAVSSNTVTRLSSQPGAGLMNNRISSAGPFVEPFANRTWILPQQSLTPTQSTLSDPSIILPAIIPNSTIAVTSAQFTIPSHSITALPPPAIPAYPMAHTPSFAVRPSLEFLTSKPPKLKKNLPSTPPKINGWIPPDQRPIPAQRQVGQVDQVVAGARIEDGRKPRMIPVTPTLASHPISQPMVTGHSNARLQLPATPPYLSTQMVSRFRKATAMHPTSATSTAIPTPVIHSQAHHSQPVNRSAQQLVESAVPPFPPSTSATSCVAGLTSGLNSSSEVFAFLTPFGSTSEATPTNHHAYHGHIHQSYTYDTYVPLSNPSNPSNTFSQYNNEYWPSEVDVASSTAQPAPSIVPLQQFPALHREQQAKVLPPLLTHKPIVVPDRLRRRSETRPSSVRARAKIVTTLSNAKRPSTSEPKASSKRAKMDNRPSTGSSSKFRCHECDELFTRRNDLERHVRCKHTSEKPFSCPGCGKSFGRKDKLDQHIEKDQLCKQIAPPRAERVRRRTARLEIPPYRYTPPKAPSQLQQQQHHHDGIPASTSSFPLGYGQGDVSTFEYGMADPQPYKI